MSEREDARALYDMLSVRLAALVEHLPGLSFELYGPHSGSHIVLWNVLFDVAGKKWERAFTSEDAIDARAVCDDFWEHLDDEVRIFYEMPEPGTYLRMLDNGKQKITTVTGKPSRELWTPVLSPTSYALGYAPCFAQIRWRLLGVRFVESRPVHVYERVV